MVIADLGIPAGFTALRASFEALRKKGLIERYSLTGRQAILYIRELAAGKPLSFRYELRAKHPLSVSAPRSQVYEYYDPSVRDTAPPVRLTAI